MDPHTLKTNYRALINERLSLLVPFKNSLNGVIYEAARYSLLGEAKRLRPLLVLSILDGYDVDIFKGLDPACSLEMVHTYSLIHDDLPSMDNDDYRRGQPTLHKKFSEAIAILAGDFLLTLPFNILCKAPYLTQNQKLALILSLSSRAGADGMVGGQTVDIKSSEVRSENPEEVLEFMHLHKTADLFIAALEFGGIIAEVSKEDFALLQEIGKFYGLAFQFIDDLLDHSPSDLSNQKINATTLFGYEKSVLLAKEFIDNAVNSIKQLSYDCLLLEHLTESLLSNILNLKKQ